MICLIFIPFLPIINKWCWGAMSICMFTGTEVWGNTNNSTVNSKASNFENDEWQWLCFLPFMSHKYFIGICQMLQLTNVQIKIIPRCSSCYYTCHLFPTNWGMRLLSWRSTNFQDLRFQMVFKRFLKTFWNVQMSVLTSALPKLMLLPVLSPKNGELVEVYM